MLDSRKPSNERFEVPSVPAQPDIRLSLNNSARDSFLKLIRTAYEMALNPSMPLKHFKILVKCQRENGVRLVEGKDDSNAAREFIHYIADAIKEKCAAVIASSHFISILSDGSQARKTNDEKELILVRTERNGLPVYFVVSLLEMASLGGTDANSIKAAIDGVFHSAEDDDSCNGRIPLTDYRTKVVSVTSDGASVNLGVYNGVLTQMKRERDWLVTIHCVNHRLELALKDAVKAFKPFDEVDRFYQDVWSLLKNSGKLKSEVAKAAEALNITYYTLSKIHGTRFLNHRRRGFSKLLHNWPALIAAFDNALATPKGYRPETRAKLTGFVKKLKDYSFLCQVAAYLDVLENMGPLSLVFEKSGLMAFEVPSSVEKTLSNFEDMSDEKSWNDIALTSYLAKFTIKEEGEHKTVRVNYAKAGHEKRKAKNREYLDIELEQMTGLRRESIERAIKIRQDAASLLCPLITKRFSTYENGVFKATTWLDPSLWDHSDKQYGKHEINQLCDLFKEPLENTAFDRTKVEAEWRSLKVTQRLLYSKMESSQLWENVLKFRRKEFPNLSILVELGLCISASNSSVERAFSILTQILSDRRLRMRHETMENCLLIKGNDPNWTKEERDALLQRAVELYMVKRRTAVTSEGNAVAGPSTNSDPQPDTNSDETDEPRFMLREESSEESSDIGSSEESSEE